jgi:putative ABC transport system substrate-binding protein
MPACGRHAQPCEVCARPGGNLTGINIFAAELVAKRLQLLREMVPEAARVAVLVDPASTTITEATLRDVEQVAHAGCVYRKPYAS